MEEKHVMFVQERSRMGREIDQEHSVLSVGEVYMSGALPNISAPGATLAMHKWVFDCVH